MTVTASQALPVVDVAQSLALIEKGQQLAWHFPDTEDMDRARRILAGALSPEFAEVEFCDVLARIVEDERAALIS